MWKGAPVVLAAIVVAAGCGGGSGGSSKSGASAAGGSSTGSAATGTEANGKMPPASNFVRRVDNPWFPLLPGSVWIYRGVKDGQPSRDIVRATSKIRTIEGVPCTAVSDRLYLNGKLEERTTDWYTQDKEGNVWYFGEATAELTPSGKVKSRDGSWLAGRDNAEPGIFMPANPSVGQSYRQEYLAGHAEDHFAVLDVGASVKTPAVTTKDAVLTKEWTPLEPDVLDHKYYVRGLGTVKEETVKGGVETNILVSFKGP